jgi:DNA-binding transcriptional LysR family regulator
LDIETLRTFVEVADAGGITAAARRLGLPKSIVSRRLARLEEDLGVQLLARTTRGAALTEAGVTFRDHAARACAEIDTAKDAAVAGLGIAYLPDGITQEYLASGALVPVMTRYPLPPAGIYVVRPPGQPPVRKIRVLTEMLVDCFEKPQRAATAGA